MPGTTGNPLSLAGAGDDEVCGDPLTRDLVLASSACTLALVCFLALSPADPSAAVSLVLMLGMMAGAPRPLRQSAPAATTPHETPWPGWRLVRRIALGGTGALLAAAVALAALLYSADLALRDAMRTATGRRRCAPRRRCPGCRHTGSSRGR